MKGFSIGRVLGFQIRIDPSWFILVALILWSFSSMVFPATVPGRPYAVYLMMGVAGTLLFFASLLAHELSHAVVARSRDVPVEGITLFLFGGMAQTRTEAESPGDEFMIAVVGPLMSLLVAVLLGAVWYAGDVLGLGPPVREVARYIAALNIVLAVFNLLPGFPLDGGRLFRAAVWKATGDVRRATRWASHVGRFMGYGLVGLGLWMALSGNFIGGLWLVFIGWFLRGAAISSYRQHVLLRGLSRARAAETMDVQPATVPADIGVRELLDTWSMRRSQAAFPVVRDGTVLGIVTEHALRQAAVDGDPWVHEVMVPAAAVAVDPDDDLVRVVERLRESPAAHVLVMRDGELFGLISAAAIGPWLQGEQGNG